MSKSLVEENRELKQQIKALKGERKIFCVNSET